SRRRHTRFSRDWSSDVCSSDLFKIDVIKDVIHMLKAEGFTCVLAMHFANADAEHPLNDEQIRQFLEIKNDCAPILASCCNSAARSEERRVGKECSSRW